MQPNNPTRLIAKVSIFDGIAYQTREYQPNIYLGDPINICNMLSDQGCQEINLVFPVAPPPIDKIKRILSVSRAPTAIGGYGNNIDTLQQLLGSGAEKVILSDSLWEKPAAIDALASHIGEQAISCSVDYRIRDGKRYVVTGKARVHEIGELETLLASPPTQRFGELILSCVSNDGSRCGLDLAASESFSCSKPLLLSGGYNDQALEILHLDGVLCSTALFLYGALNAPLTNYPQQQRVSAHV